MVCYAKQLYITKNFSKIQRIYAKNVKNKYKTIKCISKHVNRFDPIKGYRAFIFQI